MGQSSTANTASVVKTPRAKAEVRNGVRKPLKADSKCGQVWAICDSLTKGKQIPTIVQVFEKAKGASLNENNVKLEYIAWRKFYGHAAIRKGPEAAKLKAVAEAAAVKAREEKAAARVKAKADKEAATAKAKAEREKTRADAKAAKEAAAKAKAETREKAAKKKAAAKVKADKADAKANAKKAA